MTNLRRLLPAALAFCVVPVSAPADEGKWLPSQISDVASHLRDLGFTGDPAAFADLTGSPMGAMVWLGGCSASFVSPAGLIVTNHHCATGALQYNSSPGQNLLENGFLAKTRDEELWNGPGSQAFVTVSLTEVTDAIVGDFTPSLSDQQRHNRIDRRIKERTAACETDGRRCMVLPFFGGLRYYEVAQLELPDVRLVYAPAVGIGNFGGETDNWRWPRHTGDWSFFRAYAGRDGRPAPHSANNVPFHPKRWLTVEPKGVAEGDLVFVAGYPARTERHLTYEEVAEIANFTYLAAIRDYEAQIAILEALGQNDEGLRIKAASRLRGLHNSLTNRRGMLEGFFDGGILAEKQAQQDALVAWIAADPAREQLWGEALPGLAALDADAARTRERDDVLEDLLPSLQSRLRQTRTSLLVAADTAVLLARERPKKDVLREFGLQERDWPRIRDAQERMQRSLDVRIDRALLGWALERAGALPADQRIAGLDKLAGLTAGMVQADVDAAVEQFLDRLYSRTKMADLDFRLSLLAMSEKQLQALNEPFLDLAYALDTLDRSVRGAEEVHEGHESRLRPLYMAAMLEKAGGLLAPDANRTLRVTFGQVQGVPEKGRDGILWAPFTTLQGILEKNTGEGEFDAPPREIEAIRALRDGTAATPYVDPALGDVPVDFLTTVDITGGNSGSPTLNARGELVGLVFDGTYDTIASDFLFDPVRTRAIHVDVRYMLWVMSEVDGAGRLVEEMGIR